MAEKKEIVKNVAKSNEEKFIAYFKVQRECSGSEVEELFNQKPGEVEVRPGIEVPKKTENATFYLTDEGTILIKSEPYDGLEHEDLKHIFDFCEKKKWKFSIHQGYETHSPGRTLTVLYATDFRPKVRSHVRRKRIEK